MLFKGRISIKSNFSITVKSMICFRRQKYFKTSTCISAKLCYFRDYYRDMRRKCKQAEKSDLSCEQVSKIKQHWQFRLDSPENHFKSNRNWQCSLLFGEHTHYQFVDPIESLQRNFLYHILRMHTD